jgi:hypothetical protein
MKTHIATKSNIKMEFSSAQILSNILQADNQARNMLVQKSSDNYDLATLNHINFSRDWDYVFPTIYSESTQELKNNRIKDIDSFQNKFNKTYGDYFSQVDFNNILIAGGSVIGTLLQQNWNNDIDIFIYGLDEDKALQKIVNLLDQIYKSYQLSLSEDDDDDDDDDEDERKNRSSRRRKHKKD